MSNQPFSHAVGILEKIEEAGFEAYFVGGSVRDKILGRKIADVDIATSALPQELKEIFPKTTDVGIEHGTILVHHNGIPYEVTTFRSESGYSDFRRPDKITFIRSLEEDLQRRDFTMNAIAMDKFGKIIDPFGGQIDLERKLIATVGNPDERIKEDALRMMRAVRFLSQLSFSIERKTLDSLITNASLLEKISVERIAVEFEKMLQGKNRKEALKLIGSSGLYKYLPGLNGYKGNLDSLIAADLEKLSLDEMWVLLSYKLNLQGEQVVAFLKRWKLPSKKIQNLKRVHTWFMFRLENCWDIKSVYKAGLDTAMSTEKIFASLFPQLDHSLAEIESIYNELPIQERSQLNVSGYDLMNWVGKKQGPWLRALLEEIEMAVILGNVQNEKEKIRKWLIGHNPKLEGN